jgi:hypothetical protein
MTPREIDRALAAGAAEAELWLGLGLIEAAALRLGDRTRLVGGSGRSHQLEAGVILPSNKARPRHAVG